jgi:hypothetical protein
MIINAYRILVEKPSEQQPLGRLRKVSANNIKTDFRETRCEWES